MESTIADEVGKGAARLVEADTSPWVRMDEGGDSFANCVSLPVFLLFIDINSDAISALRATSPVAKKTVGELVAYCVVLV
jgi:hypothetical protein